MGVFFKLLLNLGKSRKTFQTQTYLYLIKEERRLYINKMVYGLKTCVKFVSLKCSPPLIRRTRVHNLGR